MKRGAKMVLPLVAGLVSEAFAGVAFSQNIGDSPSDSPAPAAPAAPAAPSGGGSQVSGSGKEGTTINVSGTMGQPTQSTTTTYAPIGLPAPGTNVDSHLPSSSRSSTDASRASDGFDLLDGTSSGGPVKGTAEGTGILHKSTSNVPAMHQVQRGDTLWDLCNGYFQNPWLWPKVWSYNPQIQNPHWIYPGDQVRLRIDVPPGQRDSVSLGSGRVTTLGGRGRGGAGGRGGGAGGNGFGNRSSLVPRDTVFLRDVGYIDDPTKDVWGELVGAEEEQMLLTEGNHVYVILRPGVDARPGQLLTIFRSIRTPQAVAGARRPPGEIVAFKGAVKIDQFNPKTRVARGVLVESLDTVERGDKIGPVGRRFDVVPPKRNAVDLEARVLTSMYPHEVIGQNQIAFIDRGSKDGLVTGNRLFVVERGDAWRHTLSTTTQEGRSRVSVEVPEHVEVFVTPLHGKDQDFPEEVVGELRVLRADEYSSVTLVTASKHEIEPGDRVVSRQGY